MPAKPYRQPTAFQQSKGINYHGRVLPNGRASFSLERTAKDTPVNLPHDWDSGVYDAYKRRALASWHGEGACQYDDMDVAPLVYQTSLTSEAEIKPRQQRGLKGLTSHGKQVVFNAIDYLQWRFGKQHLAFATLTLPSLTLEQSWEVSEQWSQIVDLFIQNIRRKLNAESLPPWIVGASEYQTSRFTESGIPALHLHCVYVARRPYGHWKISCEQVRDAWRSAVVSRVPSLADVSFRSSEHVVGIRKSVAAYLAKYLSKGSGVVGDVDTRRLKSCPRSWYTCSNQLKRLINRCTRVGRRIGAKLAELPESAWAFKSPITIRKSDGQEVIIAWCGQLKKGWSSYFDVSISRDVYAAFLEVFKFPFPKVFHDGYHCIAVSVACYCSENPLSRSLLVDVPRELLVG